MIKENYKIKKDKKILYFTIIDWDWIFQRPQIIAKLIEKTHNIKVVYQYSLLGRKKLQKKSIKPKLYSRYIQIPKADKFLFIRIINKILIKLFVIRDRPKQYDILWFSYPTLTQYIPKHYNGIIVYDCMDNHISMIEKKYYKKLIELKENYLLKRADIIFVSSNRLYKNIIDKIGNKGNIHLIRNGYIGDIKGFPKESTIKKEFYNLGYIGTVDSWFNYQLIYNSLRVVDNINYNIIGPNNLRLEKKDNRIKFHGVVEHSRLYNKIKDYDCLIMPFIVNDIVLSVDPVKLYEYISYGKCIISVYYDEIDRFADYVYFYSTEEEYYLLLKQLSENGFKPKYNKVKQEKFLKENNWEKRVDNMLQIVDSLYDCHK